MTLFGALSSGVSGLSAQSSAIGAISDNITNLSTIGYKSTQVDFQTLVTKQTSATFFSAGGVQSRPRQDTGTQGLLASSTSATDIALAGSGFFVVNEAAEATIADEYLFTRAGSFFQDNEGFLRNTAGYFLQAWPTDPSGVVVPSNTSLTIPNQNVISRDFLESVNLSRVGGTAKATSNISIGANLPSNDAAGTSRRTDVQFFDTLGNPVFASVDAVKTDADNNWDVAVNPPAGTSVLTLLDGSSPTPLVYDRVGQLEFITRPAAGAPGIRDG
ncbi:MAG: flagellar hook-basal body complex protein, partial [Rhodospirillales bacterium]|nr:flagellar hook-basal body complex protein [Rhodospirillales bacterium]